MTEAATINLHTPVSELPGITLRRARMLQRLEVFDVTDLLKHVPMRYEREEAESTIAKLLPGALGSARGEIAACRWVGGYSGGGNKGRFEATLRDRSGTLHLTWFNARYLREKLHAGMTIRVQGRVKMYRDMPQMASPRFEVLEEDAAAQREQLRPVYPATEGLPSRAIEQLIADVLPRVADELVEPLPADLLAHHNMPLLREAFVQVHRPEHEEQAAAARRRLAYNELLLLQLGIAMRKAQVRQQLKAPALKISDAMHEHIVARFPFKLTAGQEQVIGEIAADLRRDRPMNRLLQGDVGAGKTAVALYAMLAAVANRGRAALMAPTQLLAEQHHLSISRMLAGAKLTIELLTATSVDREQVRRADLIIGTQAILSEVERLENLAVIVIDEQHRFGVAQRASFRNFRGGDTVPHHLVMTATPIPRTLGLTIFGDLDVSTLREGPAGRMPIVNRVVGPEKTDEVYRYVATRLARGERAYVVVPAIDPASASDKESAKALRNVAEHAKLLQNKYFRGYRVAAMHGRLKPQTREKIMARFRDGAVHVLVATTVIEVGVDVPEATVMVIEHAERFGLAQLHQLRGRVGRSTDGKRSLCVFIANPTTESGAQRIKAVGSTNDGFKLAEMDFDIRGMGEFFGTRQSGTPPLRIATLPQQMALLLLARRDAETMIADDPSLTRPQHQRLHRVLMRQYGKALGLIDVG